MEVTMWEIEIPKLLRTMIGDWDDPPTYSDERLIELVLAMANLVVHEVEFDHDYAIDIIEQTIDPDPSLVTPKDTAFINLVAMKAACFIEGLEARIAAGQAITIRDQGSMISLGGSGGVLEGKIKVWQENWCKQYEKAKLEYHMDRSTVPGAAVMGPYAAFGSLGRSLPVDGRYR
jgi:hypothetical protein